MSKYSPLRQYLLGLKSEKWQATFMEIEEVLGFRLPKSAREYPAWWANQEHSVQSQSWKKAGWEVACLNIARETVSFHKERLPSSAIASNTKAYNKVKPPNEVSKPYPWDKIQTIDSQLEMQWLPIGRVLLGNDQRLTFPIADSGPALYRFRILSNYGEAVYIGETVNLRRRFGNYRNPGSSQKTSLRINALLSEALQQGAEISISAITETAWIVSGKQREQANFSSKAVRCLFENAALILNGGENIDLLNKASK